MVAVYGCSRVVVNAAANMMAGFSAAGACGLYAVYNAFMDCRYNPYNDCTKGRLLKCGQTFVYASAVVKAGACRK